MASMLAAPWVLGGAPALRQLEAASPSASMSSPPPRLGTRCRRRSVMNDQRIRRNRNQNTIVSMKSRAKRARLMMPAAP